MPSPEVRPAQLVVAGVLIAAALWALVFHLRLPGRLPSEADHQRAAAHLTQNARPGDVVLLFPWWTERARLFLPESLPVVGYLDSAEDPLVHHPRIWVLAQPLLPRADEAAFDDAFAPGRTTVGEPLWFGNLRVQLYENGRHRPASLVLSDAVARGEVSVFVDRPGSGRQRCARVGEGYRCPGGTGVSTQWHEVFYEPRRCVFLRPPGGDARLLIEAQAPQAGEALLEAGIIWEHAMKRSGIGETRVQLETPDVALVLPPGKEGFARGRAQVEAGAPLRLWVQAPNPRDREVCLELSLFGGAG